MEPAVEDLDVSLGNVEQTGQCKSYAAAFKK